MKPLPFTNLLAEFNNFASRHDTQLKGRQAYRLYVRCLRNRPALAERIRVKYGSMFPKPDDTIMAFGLMLQASRRRPGTAL